MYGGVGADRFDFRQGGIDRVGDFQAADQAIGFGDVTLYHKESANSREISYVQNAAGDRIYFDDAEATFAFSVRPPLTIEPQYYVSEATKDAIAEWLL